MTRRRSRSAGRTCAICWNLPAFELAQDLVRPADPRPRLRQPPAKCDVAEVVLLDASNAPLDLPVLAEVARSRVTLALDVGDQRLPAHLVAEEELQEERAARGARIFDWLLEPLAERLPALLGDPVELL